MKMILRLFLVIVLLSQSIITSNAATSEEEEHSSKGRKIHLHAQGYEDIKSVYAHIEKGNGTWEDVELLLCGKSEKSGQYTINYAQKNLENHLTYFIINGIIHDIGDEQQITLGKKSGSEHEESSDTSDEPSTHEDSESKSGKGKDPSKGKGSSGSHEESDTTSEHTSDKHTSEETSPPAIEVIIDDKEHGGGKETTPPAIDVGVDDEEHGEDEEHGDGGKGALNFWLNDLLVDCHVSVSVTPEDSVEVRKVTPEGSVKVSNDGHYAVGNKVELEFVPFSGYTIESVTVDGESLGAVTTYVIDKIDKNYDISIIATATDTSTENTSESDATTRRTTPAVNYTLSLGSTDGGHFEIFEGEMTFEKGTLVSVGVVVDEGFVFVGYTDDSDGVDVINGKIVMNEDKSLFALFEPVSDIDEEESPLALPLDDLKENVDDEILDAEIPEASIPKTSGVPLILCLVLGVSSIGAGIRIKKNRS